MFFEIYYASGKEFDKKDFNFFKKCKIDYDEKDTISENSVLLNNLDWLKIGRLYDYFGRLVIGDYIIIYDDYIE